MKKYRFSLGMALLFHGVLVLALTSVYWPKITKSGWENNSIIQSYLYQPVASKTQAAPHKLLHKQKPNKLSTSNRSNENHALKKKTTVFPDKTNQQNNISHAVSGNPRMAQGQYNKLLISLHNAIENNQVYPSNARLLRQQGDVTVSFQLLPSGQFQHINVIKSSGYQLLDQAAVNAVELTNPFKKVRIKKPVKLQLTLSFVL